MFIAIRDLLFAKGRFLLMGTVVALVSFLVIALSGMSAGLAVDLATLLEETPDLFDDERRVRRTLLDRRLIGAHAYTRPALYLRSSGEHRRLIGRQALADRAR